jgi:hypothetical protein
MNVNNSLVKVASINTALLLLLFGYYALSENKKLLTVQVASKRSLYSSSNYLLNNEAYPSVGGRLAH